MAAPRTFPRADGWCGVETTISSLITGLVVVSLLLIAPAPVDAHPEGGDPQTKSQQKCTNKVNGVWSKVSKATRKSVQKCINNHAKGAPLTSNPGVTTLEQCIAFDDGGKIAKTKDKTSDTFDKSCGGPARNAIDGEGFPVFPDYAVSTVPTVNAAGQQMELDLIHDLFGADLDAAGVLVKQSDPGDSGDASKCQLSVVKTVSKCMAERQKQFLKCTKTHLKSVGIYGLIYDPDDLVLCYDGMDPTKILKKCDGVSGQGIGKAVQKQCADKVDPGDRTLSELFPACATDDVATLATCLGERVACRICLSANAAADANRDCDLFDDGDTGNNSCLPCAGAVVGFESTYEGIQSIIFDSPVYGCTNALCHGQAVQGGLDLRDDPNTPQIESHANLVNVPGALLPFDRVEPGEPDVSFLYNKLLWGVDSNEPAGFGGPMPTGNPPLTLEHLEAVEKWIRGGASEDLTVEGTAVLLGSCLPEPDPLTIPAPAPPDAGIGVQFRQTPWPLPSQFEDEICMPILYDLTGTGLVPAAAMVACPDQFLPGRCTGGTNVPTDDACTVLTDCPDQGPGTACDLTLGMVNNPTGTCFAYKNQILSQDPQSHHSIIHIYTGKFDTEDAGWGPFTYKFRDPNDPLNGTLCIPTAVDATGQNPGCSGFPKSSAACLGFGPPDYTFGGGLGLGGTGGTAPQFSGSQEPYFAQSYPAGVYNILPMGGIIVWNSHAFNLTQSASTLSQYLNLDFALGAAEQVNEVMGIFDAASIFWDPLVGEAKTVPPFSTREFCRTFTIPPGAELFELGSHTHAWGVLWRTWGPPNTPCVPGDAACVERGDPPLYLSIDYTDPLQLTFDPPISHGAGSSVADRTYLYCSEYDNGATPGSPAVKRRSTSPEPPLALPIGGPCNLDETECIGPNQGTGCDGFDFICDSFPGAGDGDCDACPMRGGLTTQDEMFILLGNYFIP